MTSGVRSTCPLRPRSRSGHNTGVHRSAKNALQVPVLFYGPLRDMCSLRLRSPPRQTCNRTFNPQLPKKRKNSQSGCIFRKHSRTVVWGDETTSEQDAEKLKICHHALKFASGLSEAKPSCPMQTLILA